MWSISYLKRRLSSVLALVDIQPDTYNNVVVDPIDAAASISFNPSGFVSVFATTGSPYTWLTGGSAGNYSIFLHRTSGSVLEGVAEDTWLNLATIRTFGVAQAVVGSKTWVGTMAIRLDSPATTLETVNIAFLAQVSAADGGGGSGPPGHGGGIDP